MVEHQRTVFYRFENPLISLGLALVGLALIFWPLRVLAQSGCVGDPCVFYTPTPTTTPSPTATPMTGTPTAVPMPTPIEFPEPDYDNPTSIPPATFPDVPDELNPIPIPIPSVIDLSTPVFSESTPMPLTDISTSLTISYSGFISIDGSGGITGSQIYTMMSGVFSTGQGLISDVTSYTTYISGEIGNLQFTETFTITTAPTWYAPQMPREFANVGWTFELMDSDMYAVKRYSVNTWASIFGYICSLPVKLTKTIWELFKFLGPFGLFLVWLLVVMLPFVFGIRILYFLIIFLVRMLNFILTIIDWILKLWGALPFT
jgi:hypothetical protein